MLNVSEKKTSKFVNAIKALLRRYFYTTKCIGYGGKRVILKIDYPSLCHKKLEKRM